MTTRPSIPGRLALAALLLGVTTGIAGASASGQSNADPQKAHRSDPAANMTGEEQLAEHERLWAEYMQKYEAWLAEVVAGDMDFSKVERVELQLFSEAPRGSLKDAVRDARLIVVATVDRVEFLPSATTIVHLRVGMTLKGPTVPQLAVLQPGGPQPGGPDWQGVVLAQSLAEPLLLPGDSALLLLDHDGAQYHIQAHTGELRIDNLQVNALDTHPASSRLDGRTLGEVIDMILAEVD